jgi:hypothetical protein
MSQHTTREAAALPDEFASLKVLSVELVADTDGTPYVALHRAVQQHGPDRWAIRTSFGNVLGKNGIFVCEPRPSGRNAEFLAEYRFDTVAEALDAWRWHLKLEGDAYRGYTVHDTYGAAA